MNQQLEKVLRDFETQHEYGAVEVVFCNGHVVTIHVKRTIKASGQDSSGRENRGNNYDRENR